MSYPTGMQYQRALELAGDTAKRLATYSLMRNKQGRIYTNSGNYGTVFKMRDAAGGKVYAIKCFTREQAGREAAYRKISQALRGVRSPYLVEAEYLEEELYVDMGGGRAGWYPVLKMEWAEGEALGSCLARAGEAEREAIADSFELMVRWLLHQPFAHGDLKPDNIIVRPDGTMALLDYDGMYVPSMAGEAARETGTVPYCHPRREERKTFDAHIDDYPAVLMALLLRAMAADASLGYKELEDKAREASVVYKKQGGRAWEAAMAAFISRFTGMAGDARMSFLLAAYHAVGHYGEIDARLADTLLSYGADIEAERRMAAGVAAPAVAISPQAKPVKGQPGSINGHAYVDLGLSVKWATCNVGADSPEDYGDYYAWGETKTKLRYDEDNCETWEKQIGDIKGTSRDVAHVKWGDAWRLPTKAECDELLKKCTWTWTTQGGHAGYKVTGKNGNSIFLPAAGWRDGTSLGHAGSGGSYWSSTPDGSDTQSAYYLGFYSGGRDTYWNSDRYRGRSVRPVAG